MSEKPTGAQVIVGLAFGISGVFLQLFATVQAWSWFVVPTFHIQPITMGYAFGLGLTGRLFFAGVPTAEKKPSRPIAEAGAMAFGMGAMGLFLAWVTHLWVMP